MCVCVLGGGGGGGGGGDGDIYEHKSHLFFFFLHKTYCHDLFYRTVWSHENIPKGLRVFKIKGTAALTIKGR